MTLNSKEQNSQKKNLDNLLNNSEYAPYIDENGVLDITKVPDELKRKMLLEANSNKDIPATLIRQEENTVVGLLMKNTQL